MALCSYTDIRFQYLQQLYMASKTRMMNTIRSLNPWSPRLDDPICATLVTVPSLQVAINALSSSFCITSLLEIFSQYEPEPSSELINTLVKAFSSYGPVDSHLFHPFESYFERLFVPTGHILWTQGDVSDGLYVIESGVLRASYGFANPAQHFEESMVAGTLAGELSALSDSARNATVTVEHCAILWKLSNENIRRLQLDEPELARTFIQLVLKGGFLYLLVSLMNIDVLTSSCKIGL